MDTKDTTQARVRARDAAMRLLNRLTTGAAISALIGVGLFGTIGANTIRGSATTASKSAASSSTSASSASTSTSPVVAPSTTPIASSSGSGVAVSGGS
jgi:hypothetical protein